MRTTRPAMLGLFVFAFTSGISPAQDSPGPRSDEGWRNCRIERDPDRPGRPVIKVTFGCHSDVSDAGLARLKDYPELREVDILSDKMTDAGLEHLKALASLETVHLNTATITDKGLDPLASIPKLRDLLLMRAPITADGFARLKKIPGLRKLSLIRIDITSEGVGQLKELTRLQALSFSQLEPESRAKAAELVTLLPDTTITFSNN